MPEAAALELDEVEVRYGSVSAVRNLSLRVGKAEMIRDPAMGRRRLREGRDFLRFLSRRRSPSPS